MPQAAETTNSANLRMGYHTARAGVTSLRDGYMSRPMATTARPETVISSTPRVTCARPVSPSVNAWTKEVPTMAVTIWAMNRMPTLIATPLLDLGWRSLDDAAGVGVVI